MTAGWRPLRATFLLLEAPDSLAEQSRRNPAGYGIATYETDGSPGIEKRRRLRTRTTAGATRRITATKLC